MIPRYINTLGQLRIQGVNLGLSHAMGSQVVISDFQVHLTISPAAGFAAMEPNQFD